MWQKAKTGGKAGFDKVYGWVDKLGAPVNRLSNKVGAEAFWPTTLDKESDKAARILRSFCKDGFYQEEFKDTPEGIKQKQKVIKKIPAEVIRNARGIAIFTTMRTGLWLSGSGGAGIIVGRLPDGSWSPPSGLMLHTVGLGFLAGIDIYDCVMVINTDEALQGFSKLRTTLGGEMSVVAGPVGAGGVLDSEVHKRRAPIFTYLKSRGLYAGVQMDGTILIERADENEKFYGQRLGVMDILGGKVKNPPESIQTLMLTLRAAQGEEVDWSVLPQDMGPPPSDFEIDDTHVFGVPDKMDPDPYGVLALEKEGLQLKEAGTNKRASHEAFIFNPSPSSPVYTAFNRSSIDGKSMSRRSSWRTSVATSVAAKKEDKDIASRPPSTMVDMAVQTDFDPNDTPITSPRSFGSDKERKMSDIIEDAPIGEKHDIKDMTNGVTNGVRSVSPEPVLDEKRVSVEKRHSIEKHDDHDHHNSDDEEEPVVVVQTVQTAATPQFMARAKMVSVKKPNAPALPPRNPVRAHGKGLSIGSISSPISTSFEDTASEGKMSVDTEKRPSLDRTSSHDSKTLVDKEEKRHSHSGAEGELVKEKEKEDEFHSVLNTPSEEVAPKLETIDLNSDGDRPLVHAA